MADLGSATINERTIAESAHGLAVYFKSQSGGRAGRAVVACDTRRRSDEFARLTATTLAAHGFHVFFFESCRSTPELSFAVRHLRCDVGAMISASHNPPGDNGIKAYWSTGAQVLPPHDQGIIDCVYQAGEIPAMDFGSAVAAGQIEIVGAAVDRAYVDAVAALSLSTARNVAAVFSPLHGVGESSVYAVLRQVGFDQVELFGPHRTADGNFPNVPDQLPNPERPEVFQPTLPRARQIAADVILASDPDADRLGVMVADSSGEFEYVSGNRVGALLTDYILRRRGERRELSPAHYVVETLVTTPLIAAIARAAGVRAIDDLLVGFKYIAQTMDREGPDKFVFGAEESLGFLAGQYCRDKDAAVAAVYLLELAAELKAQGRTLLDRLDELFAVHGYFVEGQRSEVCPGASGQLQIEALMRTLRRDPPPELAGARIEKVHDYGAHEIRQFPGNKRVADLVEPRANLMIFEAAAEGRRFRVAARPSGTEPKIKFYFFAQALPSSSQSMSQIKRETDAALAALQQALSEWVRAALARGVAAS
jgi:phosphoglucomutase/phosphomannomutase